MSEATLRKVLWVDVFGSGASVVFSIAAAGLIADWLDVSAWIPLVVGVALIPWVWFLLQTVRQQPLRPAAVAVVVAGNVGWAVAAAILIVGYPEALSTAGKWIVGLFSLAVLDFGVTQWIGLRTLRRTSRPREVRMTA